MTKADIINEISLTTGIAKKDVAVTVEAFMDSVKTCLLERKESVFLRGFGSFIIKHRAEKTARNISKHRNHHSCARPAQLQASQELREQDEGRRHLTYYII